jgi:fibronectin-binding autotransporter adhesin
MFTKNLFKLSTLLVVLTMVLSVVVFAQTTIYVDGTNGDDTFNNGTVSLPYRSITKAITVLTAGSGGTISATAAVYQASTTGETDPITVNATGKTITFVGTSVGLNTTVQFTNGFILTAGTVNMGLTGTASFNVGATLTLTAGTMNIVTANVIMTPGTITITNGVLNAPPTVGNTTNVIFNGSTAIASTSSFLPSNLGAGTLTLSKTSNSAITIDNTSLTCGAIVVNVANSGGVTFAGNVFASGNVNVSAAVPVNFNGNLTLGSAVLASAADLINSSTGLVTVGTTSANTLTLYSTVDILGNEAATYEGQILNSSTGKIIVNSTLTENMKNVGIATTGADGYAIVGTARPLVLNSGNTTGGVTLNGPVNFVNTNIMGTSATINDVSHGALISNTGTGTVAIVGTISTPVSAAAFTTPANAVVNVMLSNTGGGTLTTRAAALRGTAGVTGVTNNTAAGTMTLGQAGDAFSTNWNILNDFAGSTLTLNGTGGLGGALTNNNATSVVVLGANQTIAGVVTNVGKIKLNSNTLILSGTVAGTLVGNGDIYSTTTATIGSGLVKFTGASPTSTYTGNLPNVEVASATSFSLAGQAVWGNFLVSGAGAVTIAGTTNIKGTLNLNGGNLTINGATTVTGDINMNAGNVTMGTAGLTVVGTFNMPQGTFSFGAQTLTLQGNFNRTGGVIDAAAAGTGTLAFTGTGPQTFSPGTQMNVCNVTVTNNGQYLASPLITNDIVTVTASLIVLKDFTISTGTGGGSQLALGTNNIRMKQTVGNSARFTNGGRGYTATGIGGIIFEGVGNNPAGGGDGCVITGAKPFSNIYVRLSTAANNVYCLGPVVISGVVTLDGGGIIWNAADDVDLFSTAASTGLTLDQSLTGTSVYPTVVINTVNTHGSPFLVDGADGGAIPLAITTLYNLTYTGSTGVAMGATDFVTGKVNNLALVAGTGKTIQGLAGAMAIAGNLSVDALETLNLANGGAQTLTLSSNSGAHVVNGTVTGGTVLVTGTGASLTGSGSGACSVADLQLAPATAGTFVSTGMKVIDPLTVNQANLVATVTLNSTTATVNTFTNTAGTTTLNMAATAVTSTGNYTVTAGSVNLTMGATTATSTIGGTLNVNGGTLTLGSNVTVTGAAVHNGSSTIALGSYNLTLADNYTHDNTAAFTAGSGAVVSTAAALKTYTFTTTVTIPNFTLNATNGIQLASNGFEVSNAFVHTAGNIDLVTFPLLVSGNTYTYTAGTYTYTGAGTGVVNLTGSAVVVGGNGSPAIPYVTINTTGSVTVNPTNASTPAPRVITISQLLTQTKGALNLGINDLTFTGGTGFTFTAGTISATSTGTNIGELIFNGATGFTPGTLKSLTIPNLTIAAAAVVAGTDSFYVANNLTLTAGALTCGTGRMILNDGVLITRNAGTLSAVPQFAGVVDVTYSGAVTTANELPASATALRNLKISAAVTLNAPATVNGTMTLAAALTTSSTNIVNLAVNSTVAVNAGGSIANAVVPAGAYNLTYAAGAGLVTTSNVWPSTASITNLNVAMTAAAVLNLHANRTVTNFTLNCGTGGGSFDLSNAGTAFNLTVTGTTTITSGTLTTTTSGGTLIVQGDVNAAGGAFGGLVQMAFTGANNQSVTTPSGGASIGNITINKAAGSNKVTISGGDLTCSGVVTFSNGLIVTGASNALVLTNGAGASTAKGYTRSLVAGGVSHVVGNVRQNLEYSTLIAYARNEFPVGDTLNYRPVALTFLSTSSGNFGIMATVSHTNARPTGTAGLPIANGIDATTALAKYPGFYWSISTNGPMGNTAFNLDLTAAGFNTNEINLTDVGLNKVKIIRRSGVAGDIQNQWNLQGARDSYDNVVSSGIPTVTAVNATGGLSASGAIFTYGTKSNLQVLNPIVVSGNLVAGGAMFTQSMSQGPVFGGNTGTLVYSAASSNTTVASVAFGGDTVKVTPLAAGTSTITITATDVDASQIQTAFSVTVISGAVTVSGTVTYASTSANPVGAVVVTLTPTTGAAKTATANASGVYSIANVSPGTYTLTASKTGGWGGVTGGDALVVARHAAGIALLTGLPLAAADVNNSGSVTGGDALLIVRRAAGLDASFTGGDWIFASQQVVVGTSAATVNVSGLAVGDVNASYVPATGTSFAKSTSMNLNGAADKFEVSAPSASALGAMTMKISAPANIKEISSKLPGIVSQINGSEAVVVWYAADGKTAVEINANEPFVTVTLEKNVVNGSVSIASELTDISGSSMEKEIGVAVSVPTVFALEQNYPNPFNPSTQIKYNLPQSGMVTLTIYNVMGQEVARLVNEQKSAGSYSVEWAPKNLASGMYIYRLNVQTEKELQTSSKRLMLLK